MKDEDEKAIMFAYLFKIKLKKKYGRENRTHDNK